MNRIKKMKKRAKSAGKRVKISRTTYNLLLISETVWMFSLSILGPVYAIFVEGIGNNNLVNVGLAYTAYLFTVAIFSIPFSKLSERYGKRNTIIFGSLLYLPIPFLYPYVASIIHVFMLQIWNGITSAITDPTWEALMAEATDPKKRGKQYSMKYTITYISAGIAAIVGGVISQFLGFKYMFFSVGILSIIATVIIFLIDDVDRKK